MEVGDYVRTPKGIGKIIKKYSDLKDSFIDLDCGITIDYITKDFTEEEINKMYPSSPNIIDLIEENDYINGLRVEKNKYGDLYTSYTYMGGLVGTQEETYTTFLKDYENEYIQSIVTKEQFKNMEYEVK